MTEKLDKATIPGVPSPKVPKPPKAPSLAPKSQKSAVKQIEQLKSPQMNELHMKQAKTMEASLKNPIAMTKDENEQTFHVTKDGSRITTDPIPKSHIDTHLGGQERLEQAGYNLVPVKRERLVKKPNGQWSIEEY